MPVYFLKNIHIFFRNDDGHKCACLDDNNNNIIIQHHQRTKEIPKVK